LVGVLRRPDLVLAQAESIANGYLPGKLRHRARERARYLQLPKGVSLDQLIHGREPETCPVVELELSPANAFVRFLPDETDREIVRMSEQGMTQNEIAETLQMTPRAVRHRQKAIREKAKQAGLTPSWRRPVRSRKRACR
jgi:DNA-binding NarL/FixJ family response regulator